MKIIKALVCCIIIVGLVLTGFTSVCSGYAVGWIGYISGVFLIFLLCVSYFENKEKEQHKK